MLPDIISIMKMWMIIVLASALHLQTASALAKEPVSIALQDGLEVVKVTCGNGRNTEISFTNLDQIYPSNKEVFYTIVDATGQQHPDCPTQLVTKKIDGVITINDNIGTCASSVTVVGTKPNRKLEVKYSLKLKGTQPDNSVYISASVKPIFEAKCSYNLDREMSTGALSPVVERTDEESGKIIDPNFVGLWQLYDDAAYTTLTTHVPGDIKVNVGDTIYSNLKMKTELNTDYKTQLLKCWASPNITDASDDQYIIVDQGCGKDGAQVTKTHTEKESRFSFQSFIFNQFTTDTNSALNRVYVQCTLGICMDQTDNACPTAPVCSGKVRRSAEESSTTNSYTQLVSLGPFVVVNNKTCDPKTQVCHCKPADDNCDQVCVLNENHQPTCTCKDGFILSQHDTRTCLSTRSKQVPFKTSGDDIREKQTSIRLIYRPPTEYQCSGCEHSRISSLLIIANTILILSAIFYVIKFQQNKAKTSHTESSCKKDLPSMYFKLPISASATI